MESHLQALIAYFSAHPDIALACIFAAATLEAVALIGTVVPGSTVIFAGGVLIGLNALAPLPAAIAALAGAILGDGFSYWLGRHYRERLRAIWPLRNTPALFERGQAYFAQHGGKSVFFGRFLGPVRAIVPVVAGMSAMPAARFYLLNIASAFAWAAVHIVPGALFGASLQIAGAVSLRLAILLLGLAAVAWLFTQCVRLVYRRAWPFWKTLRDRLVARAQRGSGLLPGLLLSLLDPARPASQSLLSAAVLLVGGAWLFLGILEDVVTNDPLVQFDRAVNGALQGLRTEWGDHVMVAVTEVGGLAGTIVLVVGLSVYFAYRRRWRTLQYWLAAVAVAECFVWILKMSVERVRPNNFYGGIEQFSFPSGHTTLSVVVYGFLAFLLGLGKPARDKIAITSIAVLSIALISFSRMYLGVHWLSDVLASLGLGLTWVALLSIAYIHHVRHERIVVLPLFPPILVALGLIAALYTGDRHARDLARYARAATESPPPLADWQAIGWRKLPAARIDLEGEPEEPMAIQWAGTPAEIAAAVSPSGWQAPPPWTFQAMLLWLSPQAEIGQLPVLPKLNHGREPAITLVKAVGPRERAVVRLWSSGYLVQPDAGAAWRPLWEGTVTGERLRTLADIVVFAATERDFERPLNLLARDLQARGSAIEERRRAASGLALVWRRQTE